MKKFFSNKPRAWFFLSTFVVFLMVLTSLGFYYLSSDNRTIIRVGDQKITRGDYKKELENAKVTASYLKDDSVASEESIKNTLVERAIIKIASAENNVEVTDQEVSDFMKSNLKEYNDIETLETAYEYAYGLDPAELKLAVYNNLLKKELSAKLIDTKEGKFLYARFNENNSVEELIGIKTPELKTWAETKANDWKSLLESGTSFGTIYNDVRDDKKYPAYHGTDFIYGGDAGLDEESAVNEAVAKTDVNKYSDIVETQTFYAIYFVEKSSGGRYKNWAEFIEDYQKKYVKYSPFSSLYLSDLKSNIAMIKEKFGMPTAEAACSACSNCQGARIYGVVVDRYTGAGVTGATLTGSSSISSWCEGSSSASATGWCGYSSATVTSVTDSLGQLGRYSFDRLNGFACRFNCANSNTITVTASRAGYFSATVSAIDITNGGQKYQDILITPNLPPTVVPVHPADGANYDLTQNSRIYLNANAVDPENYRVRYRLAIKKSENLNANPSDSSFDEFQKNSTWKPQVADANYAFEGPTFYAYGYQASGTVPIYVSYHSGIGNHLYSTNIAEGDASGYARRGVAFYGYSYQAPGTVPIYRYWHAGIGDHIYYPFYVTPSPGWSYEGVSFYAFASQVTNTSTVWRYWSNAYGDHYFTLASGWRYYPDNPGPFTDFYFNAANLTVKSFLPSELGVGKYCWVVMATDEQGIYSNYGGNPFNHPAVRCFTISSQKTITYYRNATAGDTTLKTQSGTTNSIVPLEGPGSWSKENYDFDGWNTNAGGTGTKYPYPSNYTLANNLTLYAQWKVKELGCSCTPDEGISPLVVKITPSGGVPPYTITVDGRTFSNRPAGDFYYTFGQGASTPYQVTCKDSAPTPNTQEKQCGVNVSDPTDPGGGEVTP